MPPPPSFCPPAPGCTHGPTERPHRPSPRGLPAHYSRPVQVAPPPRPNGPMSHHTHPARAAHVAPRPPPAARPELHHPPRPRDPRPTRRSRPANPSSPGSAKATLLIHCLLFGHVTHVAISSLSDVIGTAGLCVLNNGTSGNLPARADLGTLSLYLRLRMDLGFRQYPGGMRQGRLPLEDK